MKASVMYRQHQLYSGGLEKVRMSISLVVLITGRHAYGWLRGKMSDDKCVSSKQTL